MTQGKIKVAFVGAGNIARQHAKGYTEYSNQAQVIATVEINKGLAQAFADEFSFGRGYDDIDVMLEREHPDAVVISTPNYLHAPYSLKAFNAGAHVFCEKPIALNLEEAQQMKEAAAQTGKVLYIGFNHRLDGRFEIGKQLVGDGGLGRLVAARIAATHGAYDRLSRSWFGDRKRSGGGTLVDNGVHMIDLLRWYGQGLTKVSAQTGRLLATHGDVEDNAIALFALGTGGMASIQCSWTCPPEYRVYFFLICEHGAVDLSTRRVLIYRQGLADPEIIEAPANDSYVDQVGRFLAAVRGDEPPFVNADDGIAALDAILKAYESAETGQAMAIGDN